MIITISPTPRNYFAVLIDGEMVGRFPSVVQAQWFAEKIAEKKSQQSPKLKIELDIPKS